MLRTATDPGIQRRISVVARVTTWCWSYQSCWANHASSPLNLGSCGDGWEDTGLDALAALWDVIYKGLVAITWRFLSLFIAEKAGKPILVNSLLLSSLPSFFPSIWRSSSQFLYLLHYYSTLNSGLLSRIPRGLCTYWSVDRTHRANPNRQQFPILEVGSGSNTRAALTLVE